MDEYIDSFLSSSSWSETTLPERSSWSSTPTSQTNGFPLECSNGSSDKKSNSYVVSMDQILGNTPNPVVGMNSSVCAVQKLNDSPAMLHEQNQPCHNLPEKFQPDFENGVLSRRLALQGHASLGSNGRESSMFAQSLSDAQTIATATPKWLPVYSNMPTLTVDSAALQDLSVRGCYVDTEADILTKEHTHDDLLHVQTTLNTHMQEPGELQTSNAPSYMSGSNIDLACDGMYMNYESYNGNTIKYYANDDSVPIMHPASNLNGPSLSAKPRARARRGQATDPHSIAERLRREKISERMKNLQELVPNSNRTDKASMLDEIIDYVKFLQLQVKVLSTSRRGAASSVPPLLTDFQQEDAKELVLSSSMEAMHDLSSSQDDTEFEQEVLKLLESNVTSAMQFLRSKGLCLMPVSLATTISSRRCSSVAIPPGKKKHISTSSIAPQKGDGTRKEKRDRLEKSNGCNGAAIRRQEANKGTSSY